MVPSEYCQTQLWNKVSGDIFLLEEGTVCHIVPLFVNEKGIVVFEKVPSVTWPLPVDNFFMIYVSEIFTKWFQVTDGF